MSVSTQDTNAHEGLSVTQLVRKNGLSSFSSPHLYRAKAAFSTIPKASLVLVHSSPQGIAL